MAAPSLTVVDNSNRAVSIWDNGVVQANQEGAVLSLIIWNNRGGTVALSDLKEANITALDTDGRMVTEVVVDKWTRANVPSIDGGTNIWTPIGGNTVKMLRADGLSASDGFTIKGTANNGTLTNASANYCSVNLKVRVPAGVSAGVRDWKIRINGYYT